MPFITFLTQFLLTIAFISYLPCLTCAITIINPPHNLAGSFDINHPLNMSWTHNPKYDPEVMDIEVRYRRLGSDQNAFDCLDRFPVLVDSQWWLFDFNITEPKYVWKKEPGTAIVIGFLQFDGLVVHDWVGPLSLTEDVSLKKRNNVELLARHDHVQGGWSGWNDWQEDSSTTSASSTASTTTVTLDPSAPPTSSYSSTTTVTISLKSPSSSRQLDPSDPLSISFALTSIPVTASEPTTTVIVSSDFNTSTPSVTSVLSITVSPVPKTTTTSLPISEVSASPTAAISAATSSPPSSPATRPRTPSLGLALLSTAAVLAMTGTLIGFGTREVKGLTWRIGGRTWTWPNAKEVEEVVKGTGA